jgi:uroporphyrinogen-III synthase
MLTGEIAMPHASFDGLRVLSLESRRAREIEKLIRTYNGEPFVVPAMRELPLESNTACFEFAEKLLAGEIDLAIFLTGVGVRAMLDTIATRFDREAIVAALRSIHVAARGVKPLGALKELEIPVSAVAAEPTTWRELMAALEERFGEELGGMRVAIQEYGATNPELIATLTERCVSVMKVPVYQWGLPEDLQPLRECVLALVHGGVDVVLFMTAVQVIHLFDVARQMGMEEELRGAFQSIAVLSIGPTTTEELQHYGIRPDFEPSRPKMGFLVNEAAQYAGQVLEGKRGVGPAVHGTAREATLPTAPAPVRGVRQVAPSTPTMAGFKNGLESFDIVHEISSRIASADPLHVVMDRIVAFVSAVIPCDSCFLYTREEDKLVLRASKNPHEGLVDKLGIGIGEGVTGWVAQHREPVAISSHASEDPRFSFFANLPEDRFEAILSTPILCANRVVGVINLQHRESYTHSDLQIRLLSTIGVLVGAEIERARLAAENSELTDRLETRKLVDRAKGVLQRDLALSEEEAYRTMQRESRQRRKSMREIAEAVILGDELRRPRKSEPARELEG